MTMVEVVTALVIMTLAGGAVLSSMIVTSALDTNTDERAVARESVDATIERMKATEFSELFVRYNADPTDDPDGEDTAPGASFTSESLAARRDDPDGEPGEVILPIINGQLREDVVDAALGMPRDLDLDGKIDDQDHSADYKILPAILRVRWRGPSGNQQISQSFIFGDLR